MTDSPADAPSPRALRLQRIFVRLLLPLGRNRGREGFSRGRLRQIIRAATAPGRGHDGPDRNRMQIARLTPAMRLATDGVAQGDAKSIPLFLKIITDSTAIPTRRPIGRGASRLPLSS
ncbi:MAG: hypothetical protein WAV18_07370 [Roseiarcus sp.]